MSRSFLPSLLKISPLLLVVMFSSICQANDGYQLWLGYDMLDDAKQLKTYQKQFQSVSYPLDFSSVIETAVEELKLGFDGMTCTNLKTKKSDGDIQLIVNSEAISNVDGFKILDLNDKNGKVKLVISGNSDKGVLYGVFRLLQLMQQEDSLDNIDLYDYPKTDVRILNHWDNLDRTSERGYAGFSIWDWHRLPELIHPQYKDYARANASIGINGTVVTNVNSNALVLREDYLEKVTALADVFRPYGIQIYLTARFSAPIELGGLETADPFEPEVQEWWANKVDEIYEKIPDFGGFLVKANSEGQPGPQNYGRSHKDGANMLSTALEPHGGIVMWRAFVYSNEEPEDRAKQAYNEFVPVDGQFNDNVMIQVKNGPIDFQPREPIHPMFGAMPETPLMMEFQITQEYYGQSTHLVYLGKLYEENLKTDTFAKGAGSTVAKVIDGSLDNQPISGVAGVANIGTDRNWTGHLFGQANWYSFGRLAWDPYASADDIAKDWIDLTFDTDEQSKETILDIMVNSYETMVNYMTPLGLNHIMATGHHYGPGPWVDNLPRADWNPVYFHRADEEGLGFDRTATGSNAIAQYHPQLQEQYLNDERFLVWFQHVPWGQELQNGKSLWVNLVNRYYQGAEEAEAMRESWQSLQGKIDEEQFTHVDQMLSIQEEEAKWWRNSVLVYFQTFSDLEIPANYEQPEHNLEYYKELIYPYAPGIRPQW